MRTWRYLTTLLAALGACTVVRCSAMSPESTDEGSVGPSPQNPTFPAPPSILPLEKGNQWLYTADTVAQDGSRSEKAELSLGILDVYGSTANKTLVKLTELADTGKYSEIIYAYKWSYDRLASLIAYRPRATPSGIYIVGEDTGAGARLYDSSYLWLAYPAAKGFTWIKSAGNPSASVAPTTMELFRDNERFYYPDSGAADGRAVKFVDKCYLYKETYGSMVSFYYYNRDLGAVGYQRFVRKQRDGKELLELKMTYLLKSFRRSGYW